MTNIIKDDSSKYSIPQSTPWNYLPGAWSVKFETNCQSCQTKRLLLDSQISSILPGETPVAWSTTGCHACLWNYLPGAWSASFETNCQSCQTKRPLLDWQISWILPGEAPVAWSTKIIHMIRPAKDAMCKAIRLTKDTQRCFALIKMQYARQCASISLY